MVNVVPLRPDDWKTTRDLRLRALLDAPEAFGGTYEETARREEGDWRAWPRNGQAFAALRPWSSTGAAACVGQKTGRGPWPLDGEPVGMACGWLEPETPGVTNLIGMWVAPEARGGAAATELIDAVVDWARAQGSAAVELVVYDTNVRARRAYEKYGFTVDRPSEGWPGQVMRLSL